MLLLHKLEWMPLEALLGKWLGSGAEPILIATPMVIAHIPAHSSFATNLPDGASWHFGQVGAFHSVVGINRLLVDAFLSYIRSPGSATSKSTDISQRSRARRAPGIVLVDIVGSKWCNIEIQASGYAVIRSFLARVAEIDLPAPTHVVAF
jgi:hypothetical protein